MNDSTCIWMLLWSLLSCCASSAMSQHNDKSTLPRGAVLEIHGTVITVEELSNRLNLAPRLDEFQPDSARREAMVASIIAETILAREAEREHLDTMASVKMAMIECQKEAVYEQWMKNEITDKIEVTGVELQHAYQRFVEERIVDYAVFEDSASAHLVEQRVRKGEPLLGIAGIDGNPISERKVIEFGGALKRVEDAIFSLKTDQETGIVRADGRYYIFQLKQVRPHPINSKYDFAYWKPGVVKRVRAQKELDRFSNMMTGIMANKRFTINKRVYDYILLEVSKRIPFGNKELLRIPEAINREFASVPDDIRSFLHEPFVRFEEGEQWTVGDFWEKLRFGPFLLNYRSNAELTNDFSHLIRTMVLFESIVREGYENHLDQNPSVKRETRMWRDDLLAKLYERRISDTLTIVESDLREYYRNNRERFANPEHRRILEIIVNDRKRATDLIERIRSGEDMKELVKQFSLRASRNQDAERGLTIQKNTWGKIGEIAFSLPMGGLYGPIDLDSSQYAIVRLEEIIKEGCRPFEEVRLDIAFEVQKRKEGYSWDQLLQERSRSYAILIDKDALQEVEVLKGTMAVRKTHFPNRYAVPFATPIDYRSPWFQRIWNSQ